MQIKVNKDFLTEYKDEFWKGFSVPESVSIGVGIVCIAGVIAASYLIFGIPPTTAVYLGVPAALPSLFLGFYRYQGYMTIPELLKEMNDSRKCRELAFEAMERKEPQGHFFYMKKRKGKKRRKK